MLPLKEEMLISVTTAGESQPILNSFCPDIFFTREYGRVEESRGAGEWLLLSGQDGRWQLPLLRRNIQDDLWDAASPYGYAGIYAEPNLTVVDRSRIEVEALDWLKRSGCVAIFLRRSPLVAQGTLPTQCERVVSEHSVQCVDVQRPEASLWDLMEGRSRTAVRKAQKLGLFGKVISADDEQLNAFRSRLARFKELYDETMARVGAASAYHFPEAYYESLGVNLPHALKMAEVRTESGDLVAAALVLHHGENSHYHLSGSVPEFARMGVNNLLVWEIMRDSHRSGARTLMLGGGLRGEDALYRFKKSFGGEKQNYATDGFIVNHEAYISLLTGREQTEDSHYFPAYRNEESQ